jgi:hypothetical protein
MLTVWIEISGSIKKDGRSLIMVSLGSTCRVCGVKGKVKAIEKLPDGFAMEATHDDGTLHKWVKYYSLDSIGRRKTGKPNIIVCPKCGKKGRVNNFRPYQEDQI